MEQASRLGDSVAQFASSSGRGPTGCSSRFEAREEKDHAILRHPYRERNLFQKPLTVAALACTEFRFLLS